MLAQGLVRFGSNSLDTFRPSVFSIRGVFESGGQPAAPHSDRDLMTSRAHLTDSIIWGMARLRVGLALAGTWLLCSTAAALPTGLLNDTGQTQCVDGSNNLTTCSQANTGDGATGTAGVPRQDGRFGRDAANLTKVGGGAAGFDYTRICWNGHAQGSGTCTGTLVANTTDAATGSPSTDWACTRDNVTNLVWSLRTPIDSWTNATGASFPNAGHNTPSRCGFNSGWRMPTRRELLSLVHYGTYNPSIDLNYFPSTSADSFWTSDTFAAPAPFNAWLAACRTIRSDTEPSILL